MQSPNLDPGLFCVVVADSFEGRAGSQKNRNDGGVGWRWGNGREFGDGIDRIGRIDRICEGCGYVVLIFLEGFKHTHTFENFPAKRLITWERQCPHWHSADEHLEAIMTSLQHPTSEQKEEHAISPKFLRRAKVYKSPTILTAMNANRDVGAPRGRVMLLVASQSGSRSFLRCCG